MIHWQLQRVFSTTSHCSHQNNQAPEAERVHRERAVVARRSSPRPANSPQGPFLRVLIALQQPFAGLFPRVEAHRLFRSDTPYRRAAHQTARRHQQHLRRSRAHIRQRLLPRASQRVCDRRKHARFRSIARLRKLSWLAIILDRQASISPATDNPLFELPRRRDRR